MTDPRFGVGLTGGVGSGKSTVASMLARYGAGVVDADAISHQLTQPGGAAIAALRAAFGAQAIAPDGSLDRAHMRARVFSDTAVRAQLESLLHPMIREAMRERAAEQTRCGSPYVVFVVPLLVETGSWRETKQRVLLVDCSDATQLARVQARPGVSAALARKIIDAQATRQQRLAIADDVLMNEAPLPDIEPRVQRLHQAYLQRTATSPLPSSLKG
ncbi:MAG: dephospho-CoA kinase [Burkholderiaceae bacterium]|nr:dephospho-CoA kinase [Burkholderiaceae bacterium]